MSPFRCDYVEKRQCRLPSPRKIIFLSVRNQNQFRTSKNRVLIQKGNGSCLFGVIRGQKGNVGYLFREKSSIFLVTNQNKFERDKNPSLDQKGNVCCLFGVIMWQKGNVGCLFREKSYFLSEKSKSFWISTDRVSVQKGEWPSSPG